MTTQEYIQLRAFARVDGTYLGILWIVSFACYLAGIGNSMAAFIGGLMAITSPYFAVMRLKKFRDEVRDGVLSGKRSMFYYAMMFFYGSLLFALAQYIYFAFIDGGYMVRAYMSLLSSPEMKEALTAYGMTADQLMQALNEFSTVSPIMTSLNIMTMNITIGLLLSLPVAFVMRRNKKD